MKKLKIGHEFECPKEYKVIGQIGGYNIATKSGNLYIIGNKIFNLSTSPIEEVRIVPVAPKFTNKSELKVTENNEGTIANIFNLNDYDIIYLVLYGKNAYCFDDLNVSFMLARVFIDFKAEGLIEKIKKI